MTRKVIVYGLAAISASALFGLTIESCRTIVGETGAQLYFIGVGFAFLAFVVREGSDSPK